MLGGDRAHEVAQKLITSTLPLHSLTRRACPSTSGSAKSGSAIATTASVGGGERTGGAVATGTGESSP